MQRRRPSEEAISTEDDHRTIGHERAPCCHHRRDWCGRVTACGFRLPCIKTATPAIAPQSNNMPVKVWLQRPLVRAALASVLGVGFVLLVWHALGRPISWNSIELAPLPLAL